MWNWLSMFQMLSWRWIWKICQLGHKFWATLLEFCTICFLLVVLVLGLVLCVIACEFVVVLFVCLLCFNVYVYVYVCLNMCPLCLLFLCLCEFVSVSIWVCGYVYVCLYVCVCSSKSALSWKFGVSVVFSLLTLFWMCFEMVYASCVLCLCLLWFVCHMSYVSIYNLLVGS